MPGAIGVVRKALNRAAEIDGIGVDRDRHGFERERRGRKEDGSDY